MTFAALLFFFALVGSAAFLSAHWGANGWYRDLRKPGFTTPNWVFPVVLRSHRCFRMALGG
jgi:tryptophan-rich sensory protein